MTNSISSISTSNSYKEANKRAVASKNRNFSNLLEKYTVSKTEAEESNSTAKDKSETQSDIVVKPDGSRVLVITTNIGGMESTMSLELSKPTAMQNDSNTKDSTSVVSKLSSGVAKLNDWPEGDTMKPAFITFNQGLTGYDTVEYYYDSSSDEDNPVMYMKTKSGGKEGYYQLDINSINLATATKAELLGYYSYQEYIGEEVDMYQLMADMDMAEHNGYTGKSDNLQEGFLKLIDHWLRALKNVWKDQKSAGDGKGAAATQNLIDLSRVLS